MTLNDEARRGLGLELSTKLTQYKNDRKVLEQQLLKNLRQYRGKYDPEVQTILDSDDFAHRSKTYPRDTRVKVNNFVAKMMEMMFPATEKNWALSPSTIPNIPEMELGKIITGLQQQKQMEFEQAQEQGQPVARPEPITSDEIEAAVVKWATDRASRMEKEIEDQLDDIGGDRIEYPQLAKKILRSAAIYGFGVAEGPQIRNQQEREWVQDASGNFMPKVVTERRPYFERVKVWDLFPDLSAKHWREQEGIFRRRVFLKNGLLELAGWKDKEGADIFYGSAIKEFIREHPEGNYVTLDYESELDVVNNTSNVTKNQRGKYEVFRYIGFMPAVALQRVGIKVPQDGKDTLADIWLLGNEVIKADLAAWGECAADSYHVFIYEDDEESGLTGVGLPEVLRDSQMRLCAIDRATMDNAASVAGPIWEVNRSLLGRAGAAGAIHSFKTIMREDENPQTAGIPAVRPVTTDTHIQDYIALREVVKQTFDYESNLPSILMGDPSNLGEAFRTSSNMSMMTGAANMVTKDVVRSFDRFTSSVIGALVQWNMEFNSKEEIKGDFQVQAKGSLSLVAKEVRGAALDQLWQTMDPEDRAITDRRAVLIDRFKSRDLPEKYILPEEKANQVLDQMRQAQAQAAQREGALTDAKTQNLNSKSQLDSAKAQEILQALGSKIANVQADIAQKLATAKGEKDRVQLEHVKLLIDNLAQAAGGRTGGSNKQGKGSVTGKAGKGTVGT